MAVKQRRLWSLWLTVAGVFLLLYAALSARERSAIREEVFREVEWHAVATVDLLLREVSQNGQPEHLFSMLPHRDAHEEIDRLIRTKLGHLGLMKVKLYDAEGQIVYSTEPDLIGEFFGEGEGFEHALAGVLRTRFISPDDYEAEYGEDPPPVGMAEAYVPVRFGERRQPSYVFETYRDFTPFKLRLDRLRRESAVTLGLILTFTFILVVGVFSVNRRLTRRIIALEELLPICASCKKIRVENDQEPGDRWVQLEAYFHRRDKIDFTHGICPDCREALYEEHRRERKGSNSEA